MRKTSRKTIVRQLDAIVKEIVILRDKKCIQTGKTDNLTPGHLFSRVAYSTRWDLDNVWAQDANANLRHEYDPYPFMQAVTERIGVGGVEDLHRRYVTPKKFTTPQLIELYEQMKALKRAYESVRLDTYGWGRKV